MFIWKSQLQQLAVQMPFSKDWTPEEDQLLSFLYNEQKIHKWSLLAQKMTQEYKIRGRTGKQCKIRYQSLFEDKENSFLKESLTLEEECDINNLHDKVGNKWAMIAKLINQKHIKQIQRNDNFIKNHFFSKMRKALRRINKEIVKFFGKSMKKIRQTTIFKIIEVTDERFKDETTVPQKIIELSLELKTQLYKFLDDPSLNGEVKKLKLIKKRTEQFLNNYRKTQKRGSKNSTSSENSDNLLNIPKINKFSCDDEEQSSNFELGLDEQQSVHIYEQGLVDEEEFEKAIVSEGKNNQNIQTDRPQVLNSLIFNRTSGVYDIEQFLQNAGLLQHEQQGFQQNQDYFGENSFNFSFDKSIELLRCSLNQSLLDSNLLFSSL